jgi:lactoylglutathione lyase
MILKGISFFLWIGENRVSMLGLWGPGTSYGSPLHQAHLAIAIPLPDLLASGKRLNGFGVATYDFAKVETIEPSVIGWMPSAQLYFRDLDGHLIEFIALLDEKPDPSFIGSLSEWQKRTINEGNGRNSRRRRNEGEETVLHMAVRKDCDQLERWAALAC